MTDTPAPPPRHARRGLPYARGRPKSPVPQPDQIFDLLWLLARRFGADPASFLTEMNVALNLKEALWRGHYPARVTEPSPAMLAAAAVIEEAARHFLALGNAAQSPSTLPAGFGTPGGEVGADSQMAASSVAGEITPGEAAVLLGVSAERVRQLIRKGEIAARQDKTGRHEWHVARASVIAHRERSGHDPGSSARRRCA